MIRTLVLGAVAAVVIGFGAGSASAHEPVRGPIGGPVVGFPPPRIDFDYVVYVKSGHYGRWERYGRYETMHEARHAERFLEGRGYRVRVEVVEDRRRW